MESLTTFLAKVFGPVFRPVSRWLLASERAYPTWHYETAAVVFILSAVAAATSPNVLHLSVHDGSLRNFFVIWLSAAAVVGSFLHAKVGYRMSEAMIAANAPTTSCYEWLGSYWLGKEILWTFVFILSGAYPAIAGNVIFIIYPAWRKVHVGERARMRSASRGYFDKLRDDLFADIEYPTELTKLIGTAKPWTDFWRLPTHLKGHFDFMNHQQGGDPGYRLRSRAAGREDKEYFHIYPDMASMICDDGLTMLVDSKPALREYFDYADQVQRAAHEFALAIGRQMGQEIPELATLIEEGKLRSVLRFLHYTNKDDTEIIAAQHFDRSLYTLHLYESAPGLQFLDWNMRWSDAPIAEGKTVVFNGYRLEALTGGRLQKTWHRVVKKGDHRDRISLVLFVWTDAVSDYGREDRAQELTPGYERK